MALNTILHTLFGSHVYGTNTPQSDTDYKGIYIPSAHNILLGNAQNTISTTTKQQNTQKNTPNDIDTEFFSLRQYLKLLCEGQTIAVTMAFIPLQYYLPLTEHRGQPILREAWTDIIANRHKFLSRNILPFVGYCRQQANKYGIKGSRVAATCSAVEFFSQFPPHTRLSEIWPEIITHFADTPHVEFLIDEKTRAHSNPSAPPTRMLSICNRKVQEFNTIKNTIPIYQKLFDEYGQRALQAENNQNVDWKAMMHATRVSEEAIELLTQHTITYPRPNAQSLLLPIRLGQLPYQQVADILEENFHVLEQAQLQSTLPEAPDYNLANELILHYYHHEVVSNPL